MREDERVGVLLMETYLAYVRAERLFSKLYGIAKEFGVTEKEIRFIVSVPGEWGYLSFLVCI